MEHPISPLDGRYAGQLGNLPLLFSEFGLMAARCHVEARYLEALDSTGLFPPLSDDEKVAVREIAGPGINEGDFERIKVLERTINHDVKACELFLREKLGLRHPEMIHFGLTSEDVNNLAYGLILNDCKSSHYGVQVLTLGLTLKRLVAKWKAVPFPAHTHGQPASPTTAGKEMAVFLSRLLRQYSQLTHHRFQGKLNGATGNYSALKAAFPEYDWPAFSTRFVTELGLTCNPATTQIEDHDSWCEFFHLVSRMNNIVMDLDVDCWQYISRGYFAQKPRGGEVGSSTMPHKVNPINFENSEGNLAISNGLLTTLCDRLSRSRMQRDLSDSTVQRNMGVAIAHASLGLHQAMRGLDRLKLDEHRCLAELEGNPELLAEPIQTMLKTAGVADAYERLKDLTRGHRISRADMLALVDELPVPQELKTRVAGLELTGYVGDAQRICEQIIELATKELQ